MCGRYSLHASLPQLRTHFGFEPAVVLKPRYNIAPFETVPYAKSPRGPLHFARWGLVPSWTKNLEEFRGLFNVFYDPSASLFQSLIKKNRAIIPADGFYIWKKTNDKSQPYYFYRDEAAVFHFAAVWDSYLAPYGEKIETLAILVKTLEGVGNFPLLIPEAKATHWLDPKLSWREQDTSALLAYNETFRFKMHPVSTFMNKIGNDDPMCIRPLAVV